jgi:ATP/maltotriose-dependent transcriptional regulator MalT
MARTLLLMGRLDEASQMFQRMQPSDPGRESSLGVPLRLMLHGLLARSEGHHAVAEKQLRQAMVLQQTHRATELHGSAALALAGLYAATNRQDEALAILEPILREHEEQQTTGAIMWEGQLVLPLLRLAVARGVRADYANYILTRLGDPSREQSQPRGLFVPDTADTLTTREVEVLRLISIGANNAAIAEQLVISIHTVKTHVANILAKLNVTSRTEAAVRARELGVG